MPRQPTTRLQVSGYRFALRRVECALLRGDLHGAGGCPRGRPASLTIGCVLAALVMAGYAVLALLRPHPALDRAQIVMDRESGALYVRVGDTWHPVPNLASARLIAESAASPLPVRGSDLGRTKRGPLLGIPGAPQSLGKPLRPDESAWTICDADDSGATTVIAGPTERSPVWGLTADQAILVSAPSGSPAYLLYRGQRAVVDPADAAVSRALRLDGRRPRPVSQSLLNAVPEAPPIRAPRVPGAGEATPGLPGFVAGSVLRITRADGDEYYVALSTGVQRIGRVAADLLRFTNARGAAHATTVAPDAIRAAPIVDALPVAEFPDRAPTVADGAGVLCAAWEPAPSGRPEVALLAGARVPVPSGRTPVTLSQADGRGPALDAAYVPPGRSAYVRGSGPVGTRYLITDTGTRYPVHDDDAAHDLGLPAANPAPWPIVAALPAGPELSRHNASLARDTVAGSS